jgi:hypothetical protein
MQRIVITLPPAILLAILALSPVAAMAAGPCPNEQLRRESNVNPATGQPYSTQLPDCRGYELVSPPETGGYPVVSVGGREGTPPPSGTRLAQITSNGAVFFVSRALPAQTGGRANGRSLNVFVSQRGSGGWSTTDLTPFATVGDESLVSGAVDGNSALIFTEASLVAADLDNPLELVAPSSIQAALDLYLVGRSRSPQLVSHGALPRTPPSKAPFAIGIGPPFVSNAELSAVGFTSEIPLGAGASEGATDCYSWSDVGARAAVITNPDAPNLSRNCELLGMTRDGRAIFRDQSGDELNGEIFVDSVGDEGRQFPHGSVEAVQLSAPSSTPTSFDGVSPDGKLAYVTTAYPLGNEERGGEPDVYAVTVPAFPHAPVEGPPGRPGSEDTVVCLSCQVGGGGAATFVGQSADGSHVLFALAEASGEPAGHPYEGLWSWERTSGSASRLTGATDVEQLVLSENGEYAVGLTRQLAENPNGTADVYEFAAGHAPKLITTGVAPDTYQLTGQHGEGQDAPPTAGGVSNDGQRVVYDDQAPSAEGRLPPESVQEWTHGETVEVSPVGAKSSYYALGTAGPELEDVFFAAHEPLVPADRNAGTQDVYDARLGGGFPAPGEAASNDRTPNPVGPATLPYAANLAPPGLTLPPPPPDTSHASSKPPKLATALKACRRNKRQRARLACEKRARRRYGTPARKSVQRRGRK